MERAMSTATSLMTAEEYAGLPDSFDGPTELVKGVLIKMPPPAPRHGEICSNVVYISRRYLEDHPVGRIVCNDSSIVTERGPDTVRGPDVAFFSYARVPKGPLPAGLLTVSPESIFEVRSPNDRWSDILAKVAEYLRAGAKTVCVLDDETKAVHVFHADRPSQVFASTGQFSVPEILPDFQIPVARFFD
jgi:Uma2 family endonuclease